MWVTLTLYACSNLVFIPDSRIAFQYVTKWPNNVVVLKICTYMYICLLITTNTQYRNFEIFHYAFLKYHFESLLFGFLLNTELMYQQIPSIVYWHLLFVILRSFKIQISLICQLAQKSTKRTPLETSHYTDTSGASFISISPFWAKLRSLVSIRPSLLKPICQLIVVSNVHKKDIIRKISLHRN